MTYYQATMQHTEKTLEALSRMQYNLFCTKSRISHIAISLFLIVYGVSNFTQGWGILLTALGCYASTSLYNSANHKARKLAQQIKDANMPFPASRYLFCQEEMKICSLTNDEPDGTLPYRDIHRLGEDNNYFYIFPDSYSGYMFPKSDFGEDVAMFRTFIEEKSAKNFHMHTIPAARLLHYLQTTSRRFRNWK